MREKISIFAISLFASMAIGSFSSCSNELEHFEDEVTYENKDERTTIATRSIGGNGDVNLSNFPDVRRIKDAIYDKAKQVWWETVVEATCGTRRERGFWVYYNVKTEEIFCGNVESGSDRSDDPNSPDNRSISLDRPHEIPDSIYVCADYHTHPPLFRPAYYYDITIGPSMPDVSNANQIGIPGFVGDFDRWIERRDSINENYFQLTEFGPGRRTRRLDMGW